MIRKNIFKTAALALVISLVSLGCEDEVLVPTEDTTKADELLALIEAEDAQLITYNEENNTLTISNADLEQTLAELNAEYEALLEASDDGSQPKEVHYTINVLSTASTIFSGGRTAGVTGATVTVSQNGKTLTPSSSAAGLYLFKGLYPGEATVRISATDHTSIVASVWLYINNDEDIPTADAYNAATQFVLFPISGPKAGKLKGMAYANTTTVNDTLNRKYGSDVAFGANANTSITQPGPWENYGNYTQDNGSVDNSPYEADGIYGSVSGSNVQFENGLAGVKIYARPNLSNFMMNNGDWWENGYITQITYTGLTTSATIAADGSFELPMAAHSSYDDDTFFDDMLINLSDYVATHTRFTEEDWFFAGEVNETGSTTSTLKWYNNSNGVVDVYTRVVGSPTITIASPAVVTVTGHGLAVNSKVQFSTTGALPTGISGGVTYFVNAVIDANSFKISATQGGADINTSGVQSGTHNLVALATVNQAKAVSITRRTISENWRYFGYLIGDGSYSDLSWGSPGWNPAYDGDDEGYLYMNTIPQSGQTLNQNIYFFPIEKAR